MKRTFIKNIHTIFSGDINEPVANANAIYIENDTIKWVGKEECFEIPCNITIIDAKGLDVSSGLIDAHSHPPVVDYLQNEKAVDWAENYMAGGIVSMVSVGNIGFKGVPSSVSGSKALAVLGKQVWENYRPKGSKVHAGTIMLAKGMVEKDFAELKDEGITVVGEIGMSNVTDVEEAAEMASIAKKYGMVVTMHSGGASGLDCATYNADDIFRVNPDVVCHLNGAPTPMALNDIKRIIKDGDFYIDLSYSGNMKMTNEIIKLAIEEKKLDKILIGTNTPSKSGFSPMGLWTMLAQICNMNTELNPAVAMAMVTGNVANCYHLDHGFIREGQKADIIFLSGAYPEPDAASTMRVGEVVSTAWVMMDGEVVMEKCKNAGPPYTEPVFC